MAQRLPTYYDVLRVDRGAGADGIRRAYRRLAQQYHPDRMPDNPNAARAMAAINAAYEVLSDAHQRAEHDRWIRDAERPPARAARQAGAPAGRWASLHPARSWHWYLLFGTMAVAIATVLTATFMATMPGRALQSPLGIGQPFHKALPSSESTALPATRDEKT